jgi:hypothetical protein
MKPSKRQRARHHHYGHPYGKEIARFFHPSIGYKRYYRQGKRIVCVTGYSGREQVRFQKAVPHKVKGMNGGWFSGKQSYHF